MPHWPVFGPVGSLSPPGTTPFDFLFSPKAADQSPAPSLLGPRQGGSGHLALMGVSSLSLPCLGMEALRPQSALRLCSLPLLPEESPGSSLALWDLAPRSQRVMKYFFAICLQAVSLGACVGEG